jgi:hypothetical protein
VIWIDCMDTELVNVIGPRLGDRIPGDDQESPAVRPAAEALGLYREERDGE